MRCFKDGAGCFTIPGIHQLLRLKMADLLIDVDSPWDVFFSKDGDNIYIRARLSLRPSQEALNDILRTLKALGIKDHNPLKSKRSPMKLDEEKARALAKTIIVSELADVFSNFTTEEILRNPNCVLTYRGEGGQNRSPRADIASCFDFNYGLLLKDIAIIMVSLKEESKNISENISLVLLDDEGVCPYCKAEISKDERVDCQDCKTTHHIECFSENQECSIFGCGSRERSEIA